MKKILPIFFVMIFTITACVKDNLDDCSGIMHVYFSYNNGNSTNQFFSVVNSNVHLEFYHGSCIDKYREVNIKRESIGITAPFLLEKTLEDQDSLTLISWTYDDNIEYITDKHSLPDESYLRLKKTELDSVCSPVGNLLYGRVKFDARDRVYRNDVTLPFLSAVCRIKITMIPKTVQVEGGMGDVQIIPNPDDYTFHLIGTRDCIDYNNRTFGDKIIVSPKAFYDESSSNIITNWFGAFSSLGEPLKVNVYIKNIQVAAFDCAPIGITSVPGNNIEIVIDGRYLSPIMTISVNGWRVAIIDSKL